MIQCNKIPDFSYDQFRIVLSGENIIEIESNYTGFRYLLIDFPQKYDRYSVLIFAKAAAEEFYDMRAAFRPDLHMAFKEILRFERKQAVAAQMSKN